MAIWHKLALCQLCAHLARRHACRRWRRLTPGDRAPPLPLAGTILCALLGRIIHRVTTNTLIYALKGEKSMRDLRGAEGRLLPLASFFSSRQKSTFECLNFRI